MSKINDQLDYDVDAALKKLFEKFRPLIDGLLEETSALPPSRKRTEALKGIIEFIPDSEREGYMSKYSDIIPKVIKAEQKSAEKRAKRIEAKKSK